MLSILTCKLVDIYIDTPPQGVSRFYIFMTPAIHGMWDKIWRETVRTGYTNYGVSVVRKIVDKEDELEIIESEQDAEAEFLQHGRGYRLTPAQSKLWGILVTELNLVKIEQGNRFYVRYATNSNQLFDFVF